LARSLGAEDCTGESPATTELKGYQMADLTAEMLEAAVLEVLRTRLRAQVTIDTRHGSEDEGPGSVTIGVKLVLLGEPSECTDDTDGYGSELPVTLISEMSESFYR
jgi:hypothetical protein